MKPLFIAFTVFLLAANIILAQSPRSQTKYLDAEIFAVNNGLSQGLVSCIMQDHFGFLWLGTLDGLNRYDGYKVSVYRHDPDDSSSLSENFITSVFEDSKNRLWIGTSTTGLNLFDYEKESFIHFRYDTDQSNSLSDDRIISIEEDKFGAIWVGTKNGLNKIIISDNNVTNSLNGTNVKSSFPDKHQVVIRHIRFDDSGKELFISHEATSSLQSFVPSFFIDLKGLVFIRTENNYFCIHPSENIIDTIVKIGNLKANVNEEKKIAALISVTQSWNEETEFLYLMSKQFVTEIDAQTGTVGLVKHFITDVMQAHHDHPLIDKTLWFVHNFHLYQYVEATQDVVQIKSREAKEELSLEHSTALFKDRSGKVWLGTSGYGALKFNTMNKKFHLVKSPSIHWLYSNASDKVIIKEGDTTYLLHKNVNARDTFTWERNNIFFKEVYNNLNGSYMEATIQDANGAIWMQAEGIQKYDFQKKN